MSFSILNIKVTVPPPAINTLSRPYLRDRINDNFESPNGFTRRLTLITAPAGFGKTTLVRQWLGSKTTAVSWFSIDEEDNDRERFWVYLVSALQQLQPGLGRGTLEVFNSIAQLSKAEIDSELYLIPLLNDLLSLEKPAVLIMDDYHLIDNTAIQKDMVFFIENLPPTLHLLITSRSEPPWPLSRWRARGEMIELRQADLRFSGEETGRLMSELKGLRLKAPQLENLYKKTEGWVTGLHLAASSIAAGSDVETFIKSFAGTNRHILHYLSDEVISRQPEEMQLFLLKVSVLDRFTARLCDHVTGRSDSAELLSNFESKDIFIISLDEDGLWYRFHPLFSDILRHLLNKKDSRLAAQLHEKAAEWFYGEGENAEALRHALKAGESEKAAWLLCEDFYGVLQQAGPTLILKSLDSFPENLLRKYPLLLIQKAWFFLVHQGIEKAKPWIDLAEKLAEVKHSGDSDFMGKLAIVRAYSLIYENSFSEAFNKAEEALDLLAEEDVYWRSNAGVMSGDARLFAGNPKGAYSFYEEAYNNNRKHEKVYLSISTGFKTATSLYYMGRLQEAEKMSRSLLEVARRENMSRVTRVGLLWTLLGELLREKGKLAAAGRCIERGLFISKPEKPSYAWNLLFKIALAYSGGDHVAAEKAANEVIELDRLHILPEFITFPARAWKARLLFNSGDLDGAHQTLSSVGILTGKEIRGGRERGCLVLADLLAIKGGTYFDQALAILGGVENLSCRGHNSGLQIETLLLRARLQEMAGNSDDAANDLSKALKMGYKAGYTQIFPDWSRGLERTFKLILGEPDSILALAGDVGLLKYVRAVYRDIETAGKGAKNQPSLELLSIEEENNQEQPLAEELSAREIEILQLLSSGLSNRDIADRLYLSTGTVKWHTSNIYGKLGVKNRTHAVALARSSNLIQ